MKWKKLKELLDNEFPPMAAILEDYIGEQVDIKENINKIMVTLDLTLNVIAQAQKNNVDLIISHHPMFFGSKDEILKKDKIIKAQYKLLKNNQIGLYVIHTNADYNPNSIAYMQALALDLINIKQSENNTHVIASLKETLPAFEFAEEIKEILELGDIQFRNNFDINYPVKKVLIASGAGGSEINMMDDSIVNLIGEVKHHEWVTSKDRGIKVIEISHFSENIFKSIVKIFLEKNTKIQIILSEEKNAYKLH
ncbi:MAG: GTP cyclohydrolase 1 type 2 [Candidatus Tyloplasma litorale]|nr:MAG: GTP cyclohydrolase 1 type 2 [Mycoplasmatales bacterium]